MQVAEVLGCNDAPLGGDRVLQCGSVRTSVAPLPICFTCDVSMHACCLCIPASQNTAALVVLPLWMTSAKQTGKQENTWESQAYETARMMFADIKVQSSTVKLQIQLGKGNYMKYTSVRDLNLEHFSHL